MYISKEALLVKQSKPFIMFDSLNHVGFFILEGAKAFMYDLYYNKLKRQYADKLRLLYSDTDSFLIKFSGLVSCMKLLTENLDIIWIDPTFPKIINILTRAARGSWGC